jgi:hypothetical protein
MDLYQPGNPYKICDRCGFKKRSSETKKEWTGLIVCEPCWDPKHPQEAVRGRIDKQAVKDARPEQPDVFTTTPVTVDDL